MTAKEKEQVGSEEIETERLEERIGTYEAPPVDICETDAAIIVEADMPGVDRSGVEVKIDSGILALTGRVKPRSVEGVTHLYEEFAPVDYYRAFTLGVEVDESRVGASMEQGVLTVTLPKAERARVRKIEVK